MCQKSKQEKINELFALLTEVDDLRDMKALFEDMCTIKEVENMAERVYAARLLMQGKTYAQVMELSDISSATLSRVSRCVHYGSGYSAVLTEE